MKKMRNFVWTALCLLATCGAFVACDDDDNDDWLDDSGSKVELPGRRAYILYEGTMGGDNSGLAFYAPDGNADFIRDIYRHQNGKKLGDTGLSMAEEDDYIYVVVSGSKYVAKLNAAGVEQCRHTFEDTPRHVDVENGYVYVTQYGGRVSKLDRNTLDEVDAYEGDDTCLEGIVECGGRLYVANTYRYDDTGAIVYNEEVWVLNAATMELEGRIPVAKNPELLWEDEDKIFLISRDVYDPSTWEKTTRNQLQIIDPYKNNSVTKVTEATKLAEGDDGLLYLVDTDTDNSFFTYNVNTGQVGHSFLNNAPDELSSEVIYLLEVDDETGDIYIGTSDYVSEGTIYRFDRYGTFKEKFSAGGINPNSMLFID